MQKLYVIRDTKMLTYRNPVACPNVAVMTRELTEVANNPESPFSKHATDYELYEIGEFDEKTGLIIGQEQPVFILTLSELQTPLNLGDLQNAAK